MTSRPLFSVLTPAYNAEATVARAIESVLAQSCADWEHIVVDDGSTDSTLATARAFAERDPRVKVISMPHRGVTATRIDAASRATGTYIARLDADDRMREDYLERVLDTFSRYPDTDVVSTNGYQVFGDGSQVYYYTDPVFQTESSLSLSDMLAGNLIGTSVVTKREVYEMTGGPRPESRSEDIDLWLRAMAMGAVHRHLPESVFFYHQDAPDRVSDDVEAVWRSHVEIVEHLIGSGFLKVSEVELARRMVRRLKLKLAIGWHRWGLPLRKAVRALGRG